MLVAFALLFAIYILPLSIVPARVAYYARAFELATQISKRGSSESNAEDNRTVAVECEAS